MESVDIKTEFNAFREQCIWTRICFNIYSKLYESGPETLKLLEKKASTFFHDLNIILIEYCLIQVSKHLDPKETRGRSNLTIDYINSKLNKYNLMTQEIQNLSNLLTNYRSLIKDARNRILSHTDRDTVLLNIAIGAHDATEVSAFFENLQQYCDAVGNAVGIGPLDFRTIPASGDVIDLLMRLKRA
jgi:hypothetical protein